MLELEFLGTPRVRLDGEDLRFDTRKATALLAYLAVTGQSVGRAALAVLLWPELEHGKARATLRRTLSVATSVGPALVVDGDTIRLDPALVRCDVVEFRRLLAESSVEASDRAVALAAGRFLEGFTLKDAPEFDDWRFTVGEGLRDQLSTALRRLSAHAVRTGDFETARSLARRRTVIDPLSEPAHADLMRITAWSGDRPGAMQVYRDLVRLLDRGLGVAPVPETMALYEAIRTGSMPPPRSATPAPEVTQQVVAAAGILGRPADAELVRLVAGRDEEEVEQALADAVQRRLLQRSGQPPLYRVSSQSPVLSLGRRRLLHGRAAEALARRGEAELEVGLHFADAGRDLEAGEWLLAAADAAARRSEQEEVVEALRAALVVGRDGVAVQVALATALIRLGRSADALVALGRAAEIAGDDATALIAAREALQLADQQGDQDAALAMRSHLADLLHAAGKDVEAQDMQRRWAEEFAARYGMIAAPWATADI